LLTKSSKNLQISVSILPKPFFEKKTEVVLEARNPYAARARISFDAAFNLLGISALFRKRLYNILTLMSSSRTVHFTFDISLACAEAAMPFHFSFLDPSQSHYLSGICFSCQRCLAVIVPASCLKALALLRLPDANQHGQFL